MDVVTVAAGSIFANALTAAFCYLIWRIKQDETDTRAILGVVGIGCVVALIAVVARP